MRNLLRRPERPRLGQNRPRADVVGRRTRCHHSPVVDGRVALLKGPGRGSAWLARDCGLGFPDRDQRAAMWSRRLQKLRAAHSVPRAPEAMGSCQQPERRPPSQPRREGERAEAAAEAGVVAVPLGVTEVLGRREAASEVAVAVEVVVPLGGEEVAVAGAEVVVAVGA